MTVAFDVVFGLFVALVLALAVLSIRWGVSRDRSARDHREGAARGAAPPVPGPGEA